MMMIPIIPIDIKRHSGEGPPNRQLIIDFNYTNPNKLNLFIIDAWIEIRIKNGKCIADGRLFKQMHSRRAPAILPKNENGLGAFHINLSPEILRESEDVREGGDLQLTFNSRILVAKITDTEALSKPYETAFMRDGNERFEYIIPQSEWIKILKSLQWSELELFELPSSRIRTIPQLSRATSRFENAQDCYRRSDWEETMLNCRKAFEAIVIDTTGDSRMDQASQAFNFFIGEGEKAKRFNDLANSLGTFLHLGRHENFPNVTIKRSDAEFSLLLTGAMLKYLFQ